MSRPLFPFLLIVTLTLFAQAAAGQTVSVPAVREAEGPRVLDEEGRPVGGATVSFLGTDGDEKGQAVATSVTAPGGTFRMPPREDAGAPPVNHRGWSVMVEARGFGVAGAWLEADRPRDVRLSRATELRVKLLGPDGGPAAGVRVAPRLLVARGGAETAPAWSVLLPADAKERLSGRTGDDGVVTLAGLPRQATAHLAVLGDERFAQPDFRDAVPLGEGALTEAKPLRLRRGATVAGRVVYGDSGKPVAGARLMAQGVSASQTYGWGTAQSDDAGAYRITCLSPGTYNVFVDLPAGLNDEWAVAALERLEVKEGAQLAGKDLKLVKGGVLAGRLVAGDTKQGLAGLAIGLYGPARPRSSAAIRRVITGADGSFTFRVPPGKQYVYFQDLPPEGYLRRPTVAQDVEVAEGQMVEVTLELQRDRDPPVAGRVLLPDGAPAAGAWVSAEPPGGDAFADTRGAKASAGGRFRFAALPPGSRLRAGRDGMETAAAVAVKGGEEDVELRLAEKTQASLEVTVVDEAGKPVRGAKVQLMVRTGAFSLGTNDPAWVTDGDGKLVLPKLSTDKEYSLWVTADGYGVGQSKVNPLRVDGNNAAGPVVMRRADRFIRGRVVNKEREPLAGVQVEINGSETGHAKTKTEKDGRFEFKVPAGADPLVFMRNDDDKPVGARKVREGEEVELVYDPEALIK